MTGLIAAATGGLKPGTEMLLLASSIVWPHTMGPISNRAAITNCRPSLNISNKFDARGDLAHDYLRTDYKKVTCEPCLSFGANGSLARPPPLPTQGAEKRCGNWA